MATDTAPAPAATEPEVLLPISYKAPILMGVLGLLAFVLFGLRGPSGETTTFDFSLGDEAVAVPDLVVDSRTFALLMAAHLPGPGRAGPHVGTPARARSRRGPSPSTAWRS